MSHPVTDFPWWQKALSYLFPYPLLKTKGLHDMTYSLKLVMGRMRLSTPHAVYSFDDLYSNFAYVFRHLDWKSFHPSSLLLLGTGLGSVPYLLEHVHGQLPASTLVDEDPAILDLFCRYTLPRLRMQVQTVQADAGEYLDRVADTFDLLVIDLFLDDQIPGPFESPEFLQACKRHLNSGGLLLFNRMFGTSREKADTEAYYEKIFLPCFPDATRAISGGSCVLLSHKKSWGLSGH